MQLIDGSYCEELEVRCLEKFYAPQNHLWVCKQVAEPTRCIGKERPMRYCMDTYEFPNRKGERPMVMQNFYQAQVQCAKAGKRVCTESEWTLACEGPERTPFPYGYVRDPNKCNGDKPWDRPDRSKLIDRDPRELERLWQGRVSGSQPECISAFSVADLPGNTDELAASETNFPFDKKQNFDNVTTGGPWYYGTRNMCRPKIYTHDESFAYYYLSWRCCSEADGKPTDPRQGILSATVVRLDDGTWIGVHCQNTDVALSADTNIARGDQLIPTSYITGPDPALVAASELVDD